MNRSKPPFIKTSRLCLQSLREKDMDAMIEIVSDPFVTRSYMIPDFPTRKEAEDFFYRLKAATERKDRFIYAIYLGQEVIGFINEVACEGKGMELGYFIAYPHWNHGYATEALSAAIQTLFDLGLTCIEAAHFEENPASGKVMEKAGMHRIDKEETIPYRGKNHRCLYYQIEQ